MKTKLIALDLDNTLLNPQKNISTRNELILKKLHRKGIKIILTTGRPIKGIVPFIKQLDLLKADDYAINFNGAVVVNNLNKKTLFSQDIVKKDILPIYNLAMTYHFPLDIVSLQQAYSIIELGKSTYENYIGSLMTFSNLSFTNLPDQKYYKFVCQDDPTKLDKIVALLKTVDDLTIVRSRRNLLEFLPKGTNKKIGLEKLMSHFGIEWSEVIAFGDEENDEDMIQAAGVGVAMGNAVTSVKRSANDVTVSNVDDGVAVFLENYFTNVL
ncbi:Cof-type HAD-IIB family hydrolase [Leuconostoc sp. MS02]|uniref:Cof-type HAD-IIB family hydrolase n=1 Tax=Leuconostoc aquikimchii TaxID=3236804 RepID=A0ABV3S205_9LACO